MKRCNVDTWNVGLQKHESEIYLPGGTVNVRCPDPATMDVIDLSGKVIGKCCPYHAKQTMLLMQAANGLVTALKSNN